MEGRKKLQVYSLKVPFDFQKVKKS